MLDFVLFNRYDQIERYVVGSHEAWRGVAWRGVALAPRNCHADYPGECVGKLGVEKRIR
jgi:hypothetical protein